MSCTNYIKTSTISFSHAHLLLTKLISQEEIFIKRIKYNFKLPKIDIIWNFKKYIKSKIYTSHCNSSSFENECPGHVGLSSCSLCSLPWNMYIRIIVFFTISIAHMPQQKTTITFDFIDKGLLPKMHNIFREDMHNKLSLKYALLSVTCFSIDISCQQFS
jgi:hypothetical protein